jgi:hypothetical protein
MYCGNSVVITSTDRSSMDELIKFANENHDHYTTKRHFPNHWKIIVEGYEDEVFFNVGSVQVCDLRWHFSYSLTETSSVLIISNID